MKWVCLRTDGQFKKKNYFCNKSLVSGDSPPPLWSRTILLHFFWDPSLSLVVCVSVIKRDFWCPKYSKIDWCPGTLLLPFKKDGA